MVPVRLHLLSQLRKGAYGILEPVAEGVPKWEKQGFDIIFVPGSAFDMVGNRLGHGGGYYDRFLVRHVSAEKIGLAWKHQIVENVPTEVHDVQLTRLITFSHTSSPHLSPQKVV